MNRPPINVNMSSALNRAKDYLSELYVKLSKVRLELPKGKIDWRKVDVKSPLLSVPATAIVAFIIFGMVMAQQSAAHEAKEQDLSHQVQASQSTIEAKDTQIASLNGQVQTLNGQVESMGIEVTKLKTDDTYLMKSKDFDSDHFTTFLRDILDFGLELLPLPGWLRIALQMLVHQLTTT